MSRVVHFEIPVSDTEKSLAFYKNVFGWQFQQFGAEEYWLATTGANEKPGINGALMKRRDPAQPIVNSIDVDDMDEAIKKIEANGGVIVVPKNVLPGVGWLCYFKDPDGNISGLWQQRADAK